MIRSLLSQLSSFYPSIPTALEALFSSHQNGNRQPQTDALETTLDAITERFERVFLVLDALDECEDRQLLLSFIDRLMNWKSGKLRVIATSRKEKDIEDFFKAKLDDGKRLSIQNEKVDEDIRSYIHEKLQSDQRFERWQKQPKVQEEIEKKLMEKADGM
jgi:Cdc6-like AAA superfamily ATPase